MAAAGGTDGGFWLSKNNDEYDALLHYVNASLHGRGEVGKMEAWKTDNGELNLQFERKSAGLLKLVTLIDVSSLEPFNNIQNVCTRGFLFNKAVHGGRVFSTGLMDTLRPKEGGSSVTKVNETEYSVLYCDMAVGKAYVCDEKDVGGPIPAGYDSFYIPSRAMDSNNDGAFSVLEYKAAATFEQRDASEYCHRYMVKESSQLCPRYILHFTLISTYASAAPAAVPVGTNERDIEYFDPTLYRVVTEKEKVVMQQANRQFITVQNAYEQALIDMSVKDPLMAGKLNWMEKQLDVVDEKVRGITLNYAEIHEQITEAYDTAIGKLQKHTRQKLEAVLSTEIEIRRQKEQIEWMNVVLERHRKATQLALQSGKLNDVEKTQQKIRLLKSWKQDTVFRTVMARLKPVETRGLAAVRANICAAVNIEVHLDDDPYQGGGEGLGETSWLEHSSPTDVTAASSSSNRGKVGSSSSNNNNPFRAFIAAVAGEDYYGSAPDAGEGLVPPLLQKVVDIKAAHIKEALSRAMEDTVLPLPASLSRPNIAGDRYPLPLPEILSAPSSLGFFDGARAGGKADLKGAFDKAVRRALGPNPGNPYALDMDAVVVATPQPVQTPVQAPQRQLARAAPQGTPLPIVNPTTKTPETLRLKNPTRPGADTDAADVADALLVVALPAETLQAAVARLSPRPASFFEQAERKQQQLLSRTVLGWEQGLAVIQQGSSILTGPTEAKALFYNLPFFAKPPACQLLYSTFKNRRAIDELYLLSLQNKGGTVIIIRSGEYKFGAYLSHPLVYRGEWSGSPACFLYSLTLDVRIPFCSKSPPAGVSESAAFLVEKEQLRIGNRDLVISKDLLSGSSELELCFGIGFSAASSEARTALAGASPFHIDDLEVWAV